MKTTEEAIIEKNESAILNLPVSETHPVRDTAAGFISGIIIGSAVVSSCQSVMAAEPEPMPESDPNPAPINAVGIETVLMSYAVTDEMSFSEAFGTARAEVGPGGAFAWHGNIYSTFTTEEWDVLTEAQQQEYYDYFSETTGVGPIGDGAEDVISGDDVEVIGGGPEGEICGVVHDEEISENGITDMTCDNDPSEIYASNDCGTDYVNDADITEFMA